MNYKAPGKLYASLRLFEDIHAIIVRRDDNALPFVVSRYKSGADEWMSGRYFKTYTEAIDAFNEHVNNSKHQITSEGGWVEV